MFIRFTSEPTPDCCIFVVSQLNPIHTIVRYTFKIVLNITLQSIPKSLKRSLIFSFANEIFYVFLGPRITSADIKCILYP
jgi:hypothetical protein